MGAKEKRVEERILNRERRISGILDTAEKIFLDKGITETTMIDIAEESELSRATLYRYYKNKDDLVFAVELRIFSMLLDHLASVFQSADSGLEKINALLTQFIQLYDTYPNHFRFTLAFDIYFSRGYPSREMAKQYLDLLRKNNFYLKEAIIQGIKEGAIRADIDPAKIASMLGNTFFSFAQRISLRGDILEKEQDQNQRELLILLSEMMLYSLTNPQPQR